MPFLLPLLLFFLLFLSSLCILLHRDPTPRNLVAPPVPPPSTPPPPPPLPKWMLFLLRWLLFRLMFESGCVKLLSGDPTWRNLSALQFHYETQPLPTWLAWYASHWPAGFQHACVGVLFGVELGLPFL